MLCVSVFARKRTIGSALIFDWAINHTKIFFAFISRSIIMINPETGRTIKIGGPTHNRLKQQGVLIKGGGMERKLRSAYTGPISGGGLFGPTPCYELANKKEMDARFYDVLRTLPPQLVANQKESTRKEGRARWAACTILYREILPRLRVKLDAVDFSVVEHPIFDVPRKVSYAPLKREFESHLNRFEERKVTAETGKKSYFDYNGDDFRKSCDALFSSFKRISAATREYEDRRPSYGSGPNWFANETIVETMPPLLIKRLCELSQLAQDVKRLGELYNSNAH